MWLEKESSQNSGRGVRWSGDWQASLIIVSFPFVKNPEQSADEDAEKNEEDSEGKRGSPDCK